MFRFIAQVKPHNVMIDHDKREVSSHVVALFEPSSQDTLFVGLLDFECNKVTELSIECASAASQAVCFVSLIESFEVLIQTFRIWSWGGLSCFFHCAVLHFISFRKPVSGESDRSLAQNAVNDLRLVL